MKNNEVSKAIVIAGAALIASAFFFLYAYLAVFAPLRFNSPDEAANFFFTRLFAETGQLWSFEPLNLVVPGLVHPRSVSVSDSFMVPGGFLGLPVIYGSLAKVLGLAAVPFLTPFFGVAAAAFLGLLAARFFGRRTGAFAALLLLVQPAWWYESGRLLMPNVLFNFLLIAAAFFYWTAPFARGRAIKALAKVRHADAALAGVCLGLALAVRPAEAYWIILSVAVLVAFHFRRLSWGKLAVAGGFALLTLAPFLLLNRAVYGGFLATGYGSGLTDVPVASLPQGRGAKLLGGLRPYLFPLGFAPRAALANFWTYGVKFFWWWSLLAGTGLAAAAYAAIGRWRRRRPVDRTALSLAAAGAAAALWLMLFYGSWSIQDNPDPTAVTIGSSYLRYWLPVFALSVLPAAWLLGRLAERRPSAPRLAGVFILFCGLAVLSGAAVFGAPQEGLLTLRQNLEIYDQEARGIIARTEPDALIVVDRADKLVFPDRAVIYPLRSDRTFEALGQLAGHTPLYYFGITFPQADLDHLRQVKLPPLGLTIQPVWTLGQETLYSFQPIAKKP